MNHVFFRVRLLRVRSASQGSEKKCVFFVKKKVEVGREVQWSKIIIFESPNFLLLFF